jgi:hypothetical protein
MRGDGPWTTPYEPGRVLRAIHWSFQKLAAVYRVTERLAEKWYRFWHPFGRY